MVLNVDKDVAQDLKRPLIGVDVRDQLGAVKVENGPGFILIDPESARDDLFVNVVEPVFFERPPLQPFVDFGLIGAGQVENAPDIELALQHLGLAAIAGNTVEHEEIDIGLEAARLHHAVDLHGPHADGNVVRHELAFAGVFEESLTEIGTNIDGTEDIAAGAMVKAWNRAEDFALGSFSRSRCAKE